jgi:hypothetical protein
MDEVIRSGADLRNRSLTLQNETQLRSLYRWAIVAEGRRCEESRCGERKNVSKHGRAARRY